MSAIRRIALREPAQAPAYQTALNQSLQELEALAGRPADRLIWMYVAQGDALLAAGQLEDACTALTKAFSTRMSLLRRQIIRPPGSTVEIGGSAAIDIEGRFQFALAQTRPAPSIEPPAWTAFVLSDLAKSRLFNRDLAIASGVHVPLAPYVSTKDEFYRKQLIGGRQDTRIVLAEYEWFLDHDAGKAGQELRRSAAIASQPITSEEVTQLLVSQPGPAALLSLWSTSDRTFLYLFDKPDRPPNMISLDVGLSPLRKLSASLYTGIHGNVLFPAIDAADPGKHASFFKSFLALGDALRASRQFARALSTHSAEFPGLWHGLPWHVLLMPLFWKRQLSPGISYVPSVRTALLIRKRMQNSVGYRAAGLTSVPASASEEPLFRAAYDTIGQLFQKTALPLQSAFGPAVTPSAVLAMTRQIGLQHILAHGRFEAEQDASLPVCCSLTGRTSLRKSCSATPIRAVAKS